MIVTETLPATGERVDAASADALPWLAERYAAPAASYVRVNMVTSLTGGVAGADGTSESLTSGTDRRILGIIRAAADVVVVGAATVRAERYVVPSGPRLAILTTTGDLAGARLGDDPGDRVVVLTPAASADRVRRALTEQEIEVVVVGDGDRLDPGDIVALLAARGMGRIVCEGGTAVASQFAAAGVVDEFCLTLSPTLGPAALPVLRLSDPPLTRVAGMLVDEAGFSYYRLRPSD